MRMFLAGINFTFVPLPYRLLYINTCVFFWCIYLSIIANAKEEEELPSEEVASGLTKSRLVSDKEVRTE